MKDAIELTLTIDTEHDKHYFWAAGIDQDFSRTEKFQ